MKAIVYLTLMAAVSSVSVHAQEAPTQFPSSSAGAAPKTGEWVTSGQPSSQQQVQAAFPPTSYGPQNYPAASAQFPAPPVTAGAPTATGPSYSAAQMDASTRGLFPPNKLSNLDVIQEQTFPLSEDEMRTLRVMYMKSLEAKSAQPLRAIPRISSLSVDLSPGATMPVARVLLGTPSTLLFIDSTGQPWPLAAAPIISNDQVFKSDWLKDTNAVVISSMSPFESGTVTVFLRGSSTPVVVQLTSGEEGTSDAVRVTDARLDIRVPGRGPNAMRAVTGPGKIELFDELIQAFLDGLPVTGSKKLVTIGSTPTGTSVYQVDQVLYVRTTYDIKSPFDQTISSANGTRVYRMPLTPYLTFSDMGRSVTIQVELL